MSLRVIEGLMVEISATERVLLLDESIMTALCTLDQSFFGQSHLTDTFVEVFTLQM